MKAMRKGGPQWDVRCTPSTTCSSSNKYWITAILLFLFLTSSPHLRDRQTDRQTETKTERHDRQTDRHAGRDRQTDRRRQTDRDWQTERKKENLYLWRGPYYVKYIHDGGHVGSRNQKSEIGHNWSYTDLSHGGSRDRPRSLLTLNCCPPWSRILIKSFPLAPKQNCLWK